MKTQYSFTLPNTLIVLGEGWSTCEAYNVILAPSWGESWLFRDAVTSSTTISSKWILGCWAHSIRNAFALLHLWSSFGHRTLNCEGGTHHTYLVFLLKIFGYVWWRVCICDIRVMLMSFFIYLIWWSPTNYWFFLFLRCD